MFSHVLHSVCWSPQQRGQADTVWGDDIAGIMLVLLVPKSLPVKIRNIVMTVSDMPSI